MSAEVKTTLATGGTLLGVIVALAVFSQNEHQAIREDLRHLALRVRHLALRVDEGVGAMDRRLDAVESRLSGLEQRVGALETRFSGFERRLLILESQMGRVLGALGISAGDASGTNEELPAPAGNPPAFAPETAMPVPGTDFVLLSSSPRPPRRGWTAGN